jgi:hypothetical protein
MIFFQAGQVKDGWFTKGITLLFSCSTKDTFVAKIYIPSL